MHVLDLKPNPKNPRTISDSRLKLLKKALEEFGDLSGFVFNRKTKQLVGGHQRAKIFSSDSKIIIEKEYKKPTRTGTVAEGFVELKGERFSYREVDWDENREKAANLAANKGAGEWNLDQVNEWLSELQVAGFDLDLTMFDVPKKTLGLTDPDSVPDVPFEPKTKLGDMYQLGDHRLLCGDSISIDALERLMGGEKADLIHTDPPYNVDYSNADRPKKGKKDLGRIENDKMSDESFHELLQSALSNGLLVSKDDASIYVWYASKESMNFLSACESAGWKINQQIIWKKPMLLGRSKYQWAHEPCIFAIKGSPYFTDDRTKTTVWDFGGYDKSKNVHPTQKPVILPSEAISNSSKPGNIVLDLFGGSGSTLIACEKTNRKCYMMEIDPKYCDVIVTRWEQFTGKKAELC